MTTSSDHHEDAMSDPPISMAGTAFLSGVAARRTVFRVVGRVPRINLGLGRRPRRRTWRTPGAAYPRGRRRRRRDPPVRRDRSRLSKRSSPSSCTRAPTRTDDVAGQALGPPPVLVVVRRHEQAPPGVEQVLEHLEPAPLLGGPQHQQPGAHLRRRAPGHAGVDVLGAEQAQGEARGRRAGRRWPGAGAARAARATAWAWSTGPPGPDGRPAGGEVGPHLLVAEGGLDHLPLTLVGQAGEGLQGDAGSLPLGHRVEGGHAGLPPPAPASAASASTSSRTRGPGPGTGAATRARRPGWSRSARSSRARAMGVPSRSDATAAPPRSTYGPGPTPRRDAHPGRSGQPGGAGAPGILTGSRGTAWWSALAVLGHRGS